MSAHPNFFDLCKKKPMPDTPLRKKFTELKNSAKREEFDTGSRRDSREGKGRFDLIPPRAVMRLAVHFELGALRYGDRNWEKGQPTSRYMDSLIRHAFCYMDGQRDEDHLAAVAWNALAAIFNEEYRPDLDDVTEYAQERLEGDTSNAE
jgi:hypothetical protein